MNSVHVASYPVELSNSDLDFVAGGLTWDEFVKAVGDAWDEMCRDIAGIGACVAGAESACNNYLDNPNIQK
jgi:hypothetical protein